MHHPFVSFSYQTARLCRVNAEEIFGNIALEVSGSFISKDCEVDFCAAICHVGLWYLDASSC